MLPSTLLTIAPLLKSTPFDSKGGVEMKMKYEAPLTELIYFRSEDILATSDDIASARNFTDDETDLLDT